jgi:hypothetical protein
MESPYLISTVPSLPLLLSVFLIVAIQRHKCISGADLPQATQSGTQLITVQISIFNTLKMQSASHQAEPLHWSKRDNTLKPQCIQLNQQIRKKKCNEKQHDKKTTRHRVTRKVSSQALDLRCKQEHTISICWSLLSKYVESKGG